jgi:uncharacterized protein involved in exopolysaccharide biosynthesis
MTRDFQAPNPPPRGEGEGEAADLFDYQQLKHWVGFVWRGVGRHRTLALGTFVTVLAAGALATAYFPRTYHVESKLLANRSQVIRELGNPRSNLQGDDPTRAAEETIFARDNLVALVRQTNLIQRWQETRAPVLRLKDAVVGLVAGPMTDEDKLDAMVGTLEKKLRVQVDSKTVTILIDWPDAQLAYQIVEAAQQNFLETRHVTEMSAISEALSILEVHASRVQDQMDDALAELEKTRETRRKGLRPAAVPATEGSAPVAPAPPQPAPEPGRSAVAMANDSELAQIKFLIASKKRAAADLEDFRARRLAELTAQLAEQRVQYADQHPVVLDTLSRIEALKQDSPQLIQLRQDAADLVAEYRRKGGGDPDSLIEPRRNQRTPRAVQAQAQSALSLNELSEDPTVEFARTNLRMATAKYEELMMRIDAARIELDTARAAFKFRYSVVRPASIPKKPVKPNVMLLLIASLVGALGLAVLVGAARDLWRGRLVESWQVERTLGLKVLSEVRLSAAEAKQP